MTSYRRSRTKRRELPLGAVVCGAIVAVGGWLLGWWIVPLAALIVGVVWWDRPRVAMEAMWGGVGGWIMLLLIDSMHGRTWALARAAAGLAPLGPALSGDSSLRRRPRVEHR